MMSGSPPKRQKTDPSSLKLSLQPASITGACACDKIDNSSVSGSVGGDVITDNSKRYGIYIEKAIFTDPQAALSKLIEEGTSFGNDVTLRGQPATFLDLHVKQNQPPTESDHQEKTGSSDSGTEDDEWEAISDEQLHEMILSDGNRDDDDDINAISDDFLYSMVIKYKAKSNRRAAELNIQLRDKSVDVPPEDIGVEETRNDLEHEDTATPSGDECHSKYPVIAETESEQGDLKLKSMLRVGKPLYQLYEIDLSDIVDPRIRIVTKENVHKTVQIARYRPNVTGKVASFLEQIFEETHNSDINQSVSHDNPSTKVMDRINCLKGVYEIDKRYVDDARFVTIDLSDIIAGYDGYVFVKTRHNVEIIVKIAEKDPQRTTGISQFLTETFLV